MANVVGYDKLIHPDSATEAILKTELLGKGERSDAVAVTAYSYETFPRIDFIPVKGGDGRYHQVPVHWVEYCPISQTTQVQICGSAEEGRGPSECYHGMQLSID